jgi:hypothetical protein
MDRPGNFHRDPELQDSLECSKLRITYFTRVAHRRPSLTRILRSREAVHVSYGNTVRQHAFLSNELDNRHRKADTISIEVGTK